MVHGALGPRCAPTAVPGRRRRHGTWIRRRRIRPSPCSQAHRWTVMARRKTFYRWSPQHRLHRRWTGPVGGAGVQLVDPHTREIVLPAALRNAPRPRPSTAPHHPAMTMESIDTGARSMPADQASNQVRSGSGETAEPSVTPTQGAVLAGMKEPQRVRRAEPRASPALVCSERSAKVTPGGVESAATPERNPRAERKPA